LSLATLVDFNISKEKTTKELLDALAKLYEKTSASNKVFLMKRLFNMNMSEGGSVVYHLNEFNMVTNH
jgi:glucose-6-phosphate isomerase